MSPLVEYLVDRLERFLARRIPNLQLENMLASQAQYERTKFDTDGHLVVIDEFIGRHSVHQTTFPDG